MAAGVTEILLLITLAGGLLALVFVLSSPRAELSPDALRRFPELARFPSAAQAGQALRNAYARLRRLQWFVFLLVGLPVFIVAAWLTASVDEMLIQRLNRLVIPNGIMFIIVFTTAGTAAGAAIRYVLTDRIRRSLREQLTGIGSPICQQCGYNLTGNLSGICPECGGRI